MHRSIGFWAIVPMLSSTENDFKLEYISIESTVSESQIGQLLCVNPPRNNSSPTVFISSHQSKISSGKISHSEDRQTESHLIEFISHILITNHFRRNKSSRRPRDPDMARHVAPLRPLLLRIVRISTLISLGESGFSLCSISARFFTQPYAGCDWKNEAFRWVAENIYSF